MNWLLLMPVLWPMAAAVLCWLVGLRHAAARNRLARWAGLAELAAVLCERYGLPVSHIIRHYDVTGKLCPKYWVDDPDGIVRFRKLVKEAGEMVETSRMIVDGKEVPVERILKNGTNYVKIRDVAAALGLEVGNQGNVAVLRRKES